MSPLLIGALPNWGYSRAWGRGPAGIVGVILIVVLILVLFEFLALGWRTFWRLLGETGPRRGRLSGQHSRPAPLKLILRRIVLLASTFNTRTKSKSGGNDDKKTRQ